MKHAVTSAFAHFSTYSSTIIPSSVRSNLWPPKEAPSHAPCDVGIVTQRIG